MIYKKIWKNLTNRKVGIIRQHFDLVGELSVINNVLAGRLGEQQRVALARILIQNPEVILADEPVASLDPQRAEDILKLLVNLAFGILVDLRFYKVFSMGIFRSLLS